MVNSPADQELLSAAARGDQAAFSQIYQRYRNRVYGFAYRMLGTQEAAEDVTQEAFLLLIRQPEVYQAARGSLLTFLCAVARNHIFQHLRRQGRYAPEQVETLDQYDEAPPSRSFDPLSDLLERELAVQVETALARLPVAQREAIVLREYQELSYEEIAAVIGADTNVVKARLYRARQTLARRLAPYLSVETAPHA
ncbi:MAG TPA: RNA polymerase sigma factor [Blastocatellia bacterium]|jgi:RNA polymerase sigma-70 factor (ECF subfamily)|nr:RNA polymerase sigma factor [Blastocatellia bacterium]